MPSPPTTNPTPTEVLATFRRIGGQSLTSVVIDVVLLRVLVARGVYLAGNIVSLGDQAEFDLIEQELANRMMGRESSLK